MFDVQYGSIEYWNKRYKEDDNSPFDWLLDFNELQSILAQLVWDKNDLILLPGCGNALFSPDLYKDGYKNLLNFDTSKVVIDQMSQKFPEQSWEIQNVLHLTYDSNKFPFIIDKSLIDTIMCYKGGIKNTTAMIDELYRVLKHGGRYITFSLHKWDEIKQYFINSKYNWIISNYHIKSSRYNEDNNRRRAISCTMVVCDKALENGSFRWEHPIPLRGTLSEDDLKSLEKRAFMINLSMALNLATRSELLSCLDTALDMQQKQLKKDEKKKKI